MSEVVHIKERFYRSMLLVWKDASSPVTVAMVLCWETMLQQALQLQIGNRPHAASYVTRRARAGAAMPSTLTTLMLIRNNLGLV